jgi:hypothetical protein
VVNAALLDYCQDCEVVRGVREEPLLSDGSDFGFSAQALYNSGGLRASINLRDLQSGNSAPASAADCWPHLIVLLFSQSLAEMCSKCCRSRCSALPVLSVVAGAHKRGWGGGGGQNNMITQFVKGALLIDMLAWSLTKRGGGGWLQMAGVRVAWNPNNPFGAQLISAEILHRLCGLRPLPQTCLSLPHCGLLCCSGGLAGQWTPIVSTDVCTSLVVLLAACLAASC